MDKLLLRRQLGYSARTKGVLDEILDRFDIVIGGGFQLFDLLSMLFTEVVADRLDCGVCLNLFGDA